jgi:hypothetical protein
MGTAGTQYQLGFLRCGGDLGVSIAFDNDFKVSATATAGGTPQFQSLHGIFLLHTISLANHRARSGS